MSDDTLMSIKMHWKVDLLICFDNQFLIDKKPVCKYTDLSLSKKGLQFVYNIYHLKTSLLNKNVFNTKEKTI